jgi:hypothetical protein
MGDVAKVVLPGLCCASMLVVVYLFSPFLNAPRGIQHFGRALSALGVVCLAIVMGKVGGQLDHDTYKTLISMAAGVVFGLLVWIFSELARGLKIFRRKQRRAARLGE